MPDRYQHKQDVIAFLQRHFPSQYWELTLTTGRGKETYLARSSHQSLFVKLGVQIDRYEAVASMGLTPQVLAAGSLDDGKTIIVQPFIAGRTPNRKDYRIHLDAFAAGIDQVHHNLALQQLLPQVASDLYRLAGLDALNRLVEKWHHYKALVPDVAGFIDKSLANICEQINTFTGGGMVASHNDICNANWILSSNGDLYLIDLDSMSIDDPALDIGATLWWYYPPELRQRFLQIVGFADDQVFNHRMQMRMAMHCLNILLPREHSFDRFDPLSFAEALTDFRAAISGENNPQGYN